MFGDCEMVPICALGIRASTYPFRDWRVGAIGLLRLHRRATGVGPGHGSVTPRLCSHQRRSSGRLAADPSGGSARLGAEWNRSRIGVEIALNDDNDVLTVLTLHTWKTSRLRMHIFWEHTYSASFPIVSTCREHYLCCPAGGSWKVVHWLLVMYHSSWDPWTKLKRKAGSWWNVSIPKAEIEKLGKNRPGRHQSYGALWFPFGWRVDGITTRKAKPCQDVAWKADLHLLYTAFCRMYFHVRQIVLVDWCWLIFVGVHKFKAWLSLATSRLLLGRPGPTWDCF